MTYADSFYQALLERTRAANDVSAPLSGSIQWQPWRQKLREDLLKCLGGEPAATPLDIHLEKGEDFADYRRERILYTSEEGLRTPAWLLLPKGAGKDAPVALALHGHGWGVDAIVGLDGQGKPMDSAAEYQHNFALELCARGFVVIAPELLGFGALRLARDEIPGQPSAISCVPISEMLLCVGRTMAGARVNQARRALDVMEELGYRGVKVAMGISGGGLVCTYTTALDERIAATCISGFANTYRGSILAMHHCVDNFQPGLINAVEMPDVLSSIAPRPMAWEAGEQDDIFPIATVLEAQAIVRRAYEALGDPDDFVLDRFQGGHQISGRVSYDFLWRAALKRN